MRLEEDADITLRLHQVLMAKLQKHPALLNLYKEIEIPLISVLARIESNGVLNRCRHAGSAKSGTGQSYCRSYDNWLTTLQDIPSI